MARYRQEPVDLNKKFIVRKKFIGNGRTWLPGQIFDWRRLAVSPRKVVNLYNASYLKQENVDIDDLERDIALGKVDPDTIIEPKKEKDSKKKAVEKAESGKYKLERKAGPYFNIVAPDGSIVNEKGLKMEQARALADKLNEGITDGTAQEPVSASK